MAGIGVIAARLCCGDSRVLSGTMLELSARPDAVPSARRFTVAALAGEPSGVVEDAALVVTELVTNALLHGSAPWSWGCSRSTVVSGWRCMTAVGCSRS